MSRYIDADALQKLFNEVSTSLLCRRELTKDTEHMVRAFIMVTEMIQDAPTVDAVEVVRCRDCQWYGGHERACPLAASGLSADCIKLPKEDDFCSYSERRKEKG